MLCRNVALMVHNILSSKIVETLDPSLSDELFRAGKALEEVHSLLILESDCLFDRMVNSCLSDDVVLKLIVEMIYSVSVAYCDERSGYEYARESENTGSSSVRSRKPSRSVAEAVQLRSDQRRSSIQRNGDSFSSVVGEEHFDSPEGGFWAARREEVRSSLFMFARWALLTEIQLCAASVQVNVFLAQHIFRLAPQLRGPLATLIFELFRAIFQREADVVTSVPPAQTMELLHLLNKIDQEDLWTKALVFRMLTLLCSTEKTIADGDLKSGVDEYVYPWNQKLIGSFIVRPSCCGFERLFLGEASASASSMVASLSPSSSPFGKSTVMIKPLGGNTCSLTSWLQEGGEERKRFLESLLLLLRACVVDAIALKRGDSLVQPTGIHESDSEGKSVKDSADDTEEDSEDSDDHGSGVTRTKTKGMGKEYQFLNYHYGTHTEKERQIS